MNLAENVTIGGVGQPDTLLGYPITRSSGLRPFRLQIDSQLLTLLVQVTALDAEGACGFSHPMPVRGELADDGFALEGRHPIGERTGAGACSTAHRQVPAR